MRFQCIKLRYPAFIGKGAPPLLGVLLSLPAGDSRAGGSLFVDDATLTPFGRCQVETWARAYTPGQELTAVPACTLAGTELSLGISDFFNPSRGPIVVLGLKRLLHDFDTEPWGLGISVGAIWSADTDRLESWNLILPYSLALDPKRGAVLHANLGWNDPRGSNGAIIGGLGVEIALAQDWVLLGEALGDTAGDFIAQFGVRRSLSRDLSLDFLVGTQDSLDETPWFTVGFNIVLPRFARTEPRTGDHPHEYQTRTTQR